jgi:hypothetical protein
MTTDSNAPATERRKSPRLGLGSFLFIVVLTLILFLLAQSMERHRFGRGRRRDQLTPQTPIHTGP